MKTFTAKPSNMLREWLLIDATDKTLGRLATEVAMIL
ncbi:uL13 family ribosomal protein, partial [Francisella tularensis subsp. holarctica]